MKTLDEPISDLTRQHVELIASYDESHRLFNRLRDLQLSDEERNRIAAEWANAEATFTQHKSKLTKK